MSNANTNTFLKYSEYLSNSLDIIVPKHHNFYY